MKLKTQKIKLSLGALGIVLFAASLAAAQRDTTPKKRLSSPAVVRDVIGGESHNSYVIRARRGQTLTVSVSWRAKDGNRAEFTVSKSANFFSASQVGFGREIDNDKRGKRRWTGKIPTTHDYYIYVVGFPTVRYTLRVTLK